MGIWLKMKTQGWGNWHLKTEKCQISRGLPAPPPSWGKPLTGAFNTTIQKLKIGNFLFFFYNLELGDINSLVVKNASSYSIRKSLNVVVSRPRTEQGRRSFKHRAAIAWNSLPDTIKRLENPLSFKRKLKSIKTYVRDISFQKECSVNYNKNPEFRYF